MTTGSPMLEPSKNNWIKSVTIITGPSLVVLIPMLAAPAMPGMAAQFSLNGNGTLFAQLVMTAPSVTLIISASIAGLVAEIVGRRRIMLGAFMLFIVSGSAALIIENAFALIASRLLLGVAGGAILTGSLALTGDYPAGGPRERLLGFIVTGSSLVAVVSLLGGGHMVGEWGWRAPFWLYLLGTPALMMAAISIKANASPPSATRHFFSPVRILWPIYLLASALTIGMFMPSIQGPFLLVQYGINSAHIQSTIIAACSLVAAVSAACYGFASRYFTAPGFLLITSLCFGLGAIGMSLSHESITIGVSSAVMGIGAGLVEATCATLIMARVSTPMRSQAVGLLLSAIFFGQFLNPWVVGPLRTALGMDGAFQAIGIMFLLLSLAIAYGKIIPGPMRIKTPKTAS